MFIKMTVKHRYRKKAGLCYTDTDSFIVNIKSKGIYEDLFEDVETRFGPYNYKVYRQLPITGMMKDELDGKIMKELVALGPKMHSYITSDGCVDKKAKTEDM